MKHYLADFHVMLYFNGKYVNGIYQNFRAECSINSKTCLAAGFPVRGSRNKLQQLFGKIEVLRFKRSQKISRGGHYSRSS